MFWHYVHLIILYCSVLIDLELDDECQPYHYISLISHRMVFRLPDYSDMF